jgi:hypothetical protein
MIHEHDYIPITDEAGNVLAHTSGGFLLPLLASLAPTIISELLKRFHPKGSGLTKLKLFLNHKGKSFAIKKSKGKGLLEDAMTFLVPNIPGNGGVGFGIGFGAEGHGVPHSSSMAHYQNPIEYGEIMYPRGGTAHTDRRPRRNKPPQLRTPRTGGFAVDQRHTNAVTGFRTGRETSMFPVNLPK